MINTADQNTIFRVKEYFEIRFGIEQDIFKEYIFYEGPRGRIFLGPETSLPLKYIDTLGILIARIQRTVKPSTNFFQLYGKFVTKSHIILDKQQCLKYCSGEDFILSEKEIGENTRGFVMVSYNNIPLGCALLKENILLNQLPTQNRIILQNI